MLGCDLFGLCLVAEENTMTQDVVDEVLDILRDDVAPTFEEGGGFGGEGEIDRSTR